MAVSSATEESSLFSHGYFVLDELDSCQCLIIQLIELFIDLEVKGFLFEDRLDGVVTVLYRTRVPAFEHLDFLHLVEEFLQFGLKDGLEFLDEITLGFFDSGASFFVGLLLHLTGFLFILVVDFADLIEDVVVNFVDLRVAHGISFFFLTQRLNNEFVYRN